MEKVITLLKFQKKREGGKLMPFKHPYTLKCSYEDAKGNLIENWEEVLPNEEVANDLFERLIRVSNNFDFCFDPDVDGTDHEKEEEN